MAIVGYDDRKSAFLVQNSWGTRWGDRGYCWIHYDLFDEIRVTADGEVFCNWAVTLLDVEEKIETGPDGKPRLAPPDLATLAPKGFSDLVGYDESSRRHRYVFSATLGGQRAALAQVTSIEWRWTDEQNQARSFVTDDASNHFRLIGATAANPLRLQGTATLADGSRRHLEGSIPGPNPNVDSRTAEVVFKNTYHGKLADGRPLFWWEATLDLPLHDQGSVREVRWNVGKMNLRNPHQHLGGFNGTPETERSIGLTDAPHPIAAEIHYKDGGIKRLAYQPVLDHPVRDFPFIEVEAREMSTDAQGNTLYGWTLTLDRPRAWDLAIQKVTYELDPWLAMPVRDEGQVYRDFYTTGSSHRDFRAKATIHFNDGRPSVSTERWIELGPKSKFLHPERIELLATDRYYGRVNGQPLWVTTWKLIGDRNEVAGLRDVFFRGVKDDDAWHPAANNSAQGFAWTLHSGGPRTVDVRYRTAGGIERTLSLPHTPVSAANDALGLALAVSEEPDIRNHTFTEFSHSFSARPIGTEADLAKIVAADYRYFLRERRERVTIDSGLLFWGGQTAIDAAIDPGTELEARILFADGLEEIVRRSAVPGKNQGDQPDKKLRVREIFWGYDSSNAPQWLAELSIAGSAEEISPTSTVQYTLTGRSGTAKPWNLEGKPGQTSHVLLREPNTICANIALTDGTQLILENEARAATARPALPLQIHRWRTVQAEGKTTPVLALVGWESKLRDIQEVTYRTTDHSERVSWRDARGYANFGVEFPLPQLTTVTAELLFKNGSRETLSRALTANDPLGLTQDIRYWGEGKWEVDFHVTGPVEQRRAFYLNPDFVAEPDNPADPFSRVSIYRLPATPSHTGRGIFPTGPHRLKEFQYNTQPQEVLKIPGHAFATENAPGENLTVQIQRHPHQPAGAKSSEWIIFLRGPEKLLSQVESVTYSADQKPAQSIPHRWGEQHAGFELHILQPDPPRVAATIFLRDGRQIKISSAD